MTFHHLTALICLFSTLHLITKHVVHAQPITTDTPIETIDPGFYSALVALLPDDYELVNNVNTWNFTQIYNLLTRDNPDLFYDLPTSIVLQFPESMLEWLGEEHPGVISAHDLCWYLTIAQQIEYNCTVNGTNYYNYTSDSICPIPFVETNRHSVFYQGCNLECKYSNLLWAQPTDVTIRVNICKYIFVGLSLLFFCLVGINQMWDAKDSREFFCHRPIIAQCTFFIIIGFANLMSQFFIIPIIGADNVLCQPETNNKRGVSFGNPAAEWAPCSILGIHFYFCLNIANLYVAAFTFGLWKQFYAPLSHSYLAKCIRYIDSSDSNSPASPRSQSLKRVASADGTHGGHGTRFNSHHGSNNNENNNTLKNYTCRCSDIANCWYNCLESFSTCIKSPNLKYHLIIWVIATVLTISMTSQDMISGFHPMGICYGGNDDNKTTFWYSLFPLLISTIFLILFVPHAFYLLCKTRNQVASDSAKHKLEHLGCRLGFYFFGTLLSMICITLMAAYINSLFPKMHKGAEKRIECMLFGGEYDECLNGYYIPEYTFYFCYISLFLAGLSSFVLSMHARQIKRWLDFCPCLRYIVNIMPQCCDQNGVLLKIVDGTYFHQRKSNVNINMHEMSHRNSKKTNVNANMPPQILRPKSPSSKSFTLEIS